MKLKIRQLLILLLLIVILLIPASYKIAGDLPSDWFISKFKESILNEVSGGLIFSYSVIIFLEIVGPLLLLASIIQALRKKEFEKLRSYGFITYYLLFILLTFGSFLVQDYNNGFKDFMYFIGIAILEKYFFENKENNA